MPVLTIPALGQVALTVDQQVLAQHIVHQTEAIYPPIAEAAKVQGPVVIELKVGRTGTIESIGVISGPLMLQQAALDSVEQWTFRPFEKDGVVTPAISRVSILFDLNFSPFTFNFRSNPPTRREEDVVSRFTSASKKCRKALAADEKSSAAADLCKQAADFTDQLAVGSQMADLNSAFVSAAWALNNNGRPAEALIYAQKAVDAAKQNYDDALNADAYGVSGIIEVNLKNLNAADRDLTMAEDFERKTILWADEVNFKHSGSLRTALKLYLNRHAVALIALNRPDDAQRKLDEASKLQ